MRKCERLGCERRNPNPGRGKYLCPEHADAPCAYPGCQSRARTKGLCHSHYNGEWRKKKQERIGTHGQAEHMRWVHVLRRYGLTEEQYNALSLSQHHVCKICEQPQNDKRGRLFIDHDHSSGRVRGLLCQACNSLLGYARDSVDILEAAKHYLTEG